MAVLEWDKTGERVYETGVDRGVLFIPNAQGAYANGYAWNGLVSVTESPSGAEANKQYADNQVYVNLISNEELGGTIEAFTYPTEFAQCDGTLFATAGVAIGQQARKSFGLAYRTRVGNDLQGTDFGYKIHLLYGATASPTEKGFTTINDSPEAITFSWEFSTTGVAIPGTNYRPAALLTIDSTKTTAAKIAALEAIIYGTAGADARLPLPAEVIALFGTTATATPVQPAYNATNKQITIPTTTGVDYQIDGVTRTGVVTITKNTIVRAVPKAGYTFPADIDDDWMYTF